MLLALGSWLLALGSWLLAFMAAQNYRYESGSKAIFSVNVYQHGVEQAFQACGKAAE
jgi:hypothetical protein